MAQGDLTKEIEYDKIEVVMQWNIQVRKATKVMEEQADGSKKEMTRSFHRHVLQPFRSEKGEDASVQAIANAAWTDDVKTAYKTFVESQTTL